MSRMLLVGRGPLPGPAEPMVAFPQLRVASFARVLVAVGHEVGLALLGERGQGTLSGVGRAWSLPGEGAAWLRPLRTCVAEWRPDALVAAGPHLPARAAVAAAGEVPVWVDVPGDPFAEAQARADREGGDPTEARAVAHLGALVRGDAFSACSQRQRLALLGQLGLAGRFAEGEAPPVHAVPPTWDFAGLPPGPPRRRRPRDPLVVALSGSANTWTDTGTLAEGLLRAMDRQPGIRVVVTGGGVPGFYTGGEAELRARLGAHGDRVRFHGWLPHGRVPEVLAQAHLLLNLDRPGMEPLLGSRTRLVLALHQGLEVATTPATELGEALCARGFARPVAPGDPEALASVLEQAWRDGTDPDRIHAGAAWLAETLDPAVVLRPLVAWAAAPGRAPPGDPAWARLARRHAEVEAELDAVHQSPTWRVLGGVHARLRRLSGRNP